MDTRPRRPGTDASREPHASRKRLLRGTAAGARHVGVPCFRACRVAAAMIENKGFRLRRIVGFFDAALAAFRHACWGLTAAGVLAGAHLTLRSSGKLETVIWLPREIALWCDRHGELRNLPAFFLLALPGLIALRRPCQRVTAILAIALLGTLFEFSQLALPGRWFEWQDIAITWLGVFTAWIGSESGRWLLRRLRRMSAAAFQSLSGAKAT
jgi:hypothetical protein